MHAVHVGTLAGSSTTRRPTTRSVAVAVHIAGRAGNADCYVGMAVAWQNVQSVEQHLEHLQVVKGCWQAACGQHIIRSVSRAVVRLQTNLLSCQARLCL